MAEKTALVREELRALIERESARRLARLGGASLNYKQPLVGNPDQHGSS
jgi:hypothetical protein